MTDTAPEQFDPGAHTVAEVNDHLATLDPQGPEYAAVLDAERAGQARKGILGDDAPQEPQGGVQDARNTSTRAQTFPEAAKAAQEGPHAFGASPERERTGLSDKGLSQRNPAVMNRGGTLTDPRHGIGTVATTPDSDDTQEA